LTYTYTNTPTATPTHQAVVIADDGGVYIYPNPFSPLKQQGITVAYEADTRHTSVEFLVYSVSYRLALKKVIAVNNDAGLHSVFIGRQVFKSLANGTYYYVVALKQGNEVQKLKPGSLIIIK